jgi:NAD(P)-dependent dehydrogenase (short-subunit alcohol dehydrogenase family)
MIARRCGRIINLAGGGAVAPFPYGSGYASSKAAIVRFSETLAAEAREHGITVYAMDPGLVRTGLTERLMASAAGQEWLPSVGARLTTGRDVPPERVGQLAVFLASVAGDELSGRLIHVDDNLAELARRTAEIQRNDLYVLRLRK